jgi:hypothetical protein
MAGHRFKRMRAASAAIAIFMGLKYEIEVVSPPQRTI